MSLRPPTTAYVVDDESVIASTVAMILNNSGFDAKAFLSAEEAIAAVKSGSPDLLITDVGMPGMNGIELAITLKAMCPECKVLLFSGQASTVDLLGKARDQGYDFQVLTKPVHPTDLIRAIRKMSASPAPGLMD